MDDMRLPNDLDTARAIIAALRSQVERQAVELSVKDHLIEEQAHSVLELKADADKLDERVVELNLIIEKLLKQLYGRQSERRLDGEGQLFLNFGEAPTPEVVSAWKKRSARHGKSSTTRKKIENRAVAEGPNEATASSPSTCRATKRSSICLKSGAKAWC